MAKKLEQNESILDAVLQAESEKPKTTDALNYWQINPTGKLSVALREAKLDWNVEKSALLNPYTHEPLDNTFGLFRTDTKAMLGVFKGRYQEFDNAKVFSVLEPFLDAGYQISHAGSLGGGKKVFMALDSGGFEVVKGDVSKNYLSVTNAHDGTGLIKFGLTNTRIVCYNTFYYAGRELAKYLSFKHTPSGEVKLVAVKEALEGIDVEMRNLHGLLTELAKRELTQKDIQRIQAKLFPMPDETDDNQKTITRRQNQIDAFNEIFESADGGRSKETRGTAYGLFQAVTNYNSHAATVKGKDADIRRAESVLFDKLAVESQDALNLILAETEKAKRSDRLPFVPYSRIAPDSNVWANAR